MNHRLVPLFIFVTVMVSCIKDNQSSKYRRPLFDSEKRQPAINDRFVPEQYQEFLA